MKPPAWLWGLLAVPCLLVLALPSTKRDPHHTDDPAVTRWARNIHKGD